jgi:copper oxidase (laccase) domain-containing protein
MQVFCASDALTAGGFKQAAAPDKYMADLAWLARHLLRQYGLTDVQGNDSSAPWCTFLQQTSFFSHRRDGVSGRFAAGIALV